MSVEINKDIFQFQTQFEETIEILSKEEGSILTEEGFISDPFLILKHILLQDPGNIVAKVLLKSSSDLYRKYGNNSYLYFWLLNHFYQNTKKFIVKEEEFKKALEEQTIYINIEAGSTDEFLLKHGISELVVNAFDKADGKELFLKKGLETEIVQNSGFELKVKNREDFIAVDSAILVIESAPELDKVVSLINQTTQPLTVISLEASKDLVELERLNPGSGFRYVQAVSEYLRSDFILDLKTVVNQVLSSSAMISSSLALGRGKIICSDNVVTLISKDSFIKNQRIQGLEEEVNKEASPLRKMFLNKRLTNLRGDKTTLFVSANSEKEKDKKLNEYFTQILEAINMLNTSAVINGDIPEAEKYSTDCVNTAFNRAKIDLQLLFSPVQIHQI